MYPYVPGFGPAPCKLMVIGEAPGRNEEELRRPFVGITGKMLDDALRSAGTSLNECYRTNVFKYRPPNNSWKRLTETGHTLEECLPQLGEEINAANPNAILALGNNALLYTAGKDGIKKYRGSILPGLHGPKVIGTIHPAALFHQEDGKGALPWSAWKYIQLDIKRAVEESKTKDLDLPQHTLEIAWTAGDLLAFFNRYHDKKRVSVDIEVIRCIPICIGFAFNEWHGISVPLVDIPGKLSIPMVEKVAIHRLVQRFLERDDIEILGQNFKFDDEKIRSVLRVAATPISVDTGMLAHTLYAEFPKALEFWTSILTRVPYYKSELREYNHKRDKIDQILFYNAKDVCVPFEVGQKLEKEARERNLWDYYKQYINPLHELYLGIEQEGIPVDFRYKEFLRDKYNGLRVRKEAELWLAAGWEVNVNSNGQKGDVAKLLYGKDSVGQFPLRKKADEETLTALYANHAKTDFQRHLIQLILDIRKIRKTISTYIEAEPDYDGRMRTSYSICGTETGRSSTKVLKSPVRPFQVGLTFHNLTKHGELGADLRRMFVADEGHIILNCDLSQAEPRVVATLATDDDLLKDFANKIDVHAKAASICIGGPYEIYTKAYHNGEECPERFLGKTIRNAGNYRMGKKRAMITINTDAKKYNIPIQVSEWKAGLFLEKFHKACPKVSGIFWKEIEACLKRNRTLRDPFGGERIFFGQSGDELLKEALAHIPQKTVKTQLNRAMLALKGSRTLGTTGRIPELRIWCESHDAFSAMVPLDKLEQWAPIIREEMERPIDFSKCSLPRGELIIPCEIEVGFNYLDLKKWKPGLDVEKLRNAA